MTHRHCPYCNSTAVIGLGAFTDSTQTVVEMRCRQCGEMFFSDDRRTPDDERRDPDKDERTGT